MLPRRRPRAPPAAKAAALAAAFAAALALCAARPAAAAPSEGGDLRPNILFILTDDQDTYLGSDQHMPNLAKTMAVRVVEQGARGATACAGGREGGARARVGTQHINPTACSAVARVGRAAGGGKKGKAGQQTRATLCTPCRAGRRRVEARRHVL